MALQRLSEINQAGFGKDACADCQRGDVEGEESAIIDFTLSRLVVDGQPKKSCSKEVCLLK